jgi:hypothetical protein
MINIHPRTVVIHLIIIYKFYVDYSALISLKYMSLMSEKILFPTYTALKQESSETLWFIR